MTVLAVSMSMTGWKTRSLSSYRITDLATQVEAADDLIHKGRIPEIGSVSSYFGRIPPGTSWLLVPGVLVFDDPRLFQVPASAFLFLLTLAGIVVTGRALFSEALGWLAASLYALSSIGLFFSSSLWPRGHPFFVIWTLYFCFLAVQNSQPVWLVLAATLYILGMYVFLEIAPLAIVFILALWYRRKLLVWWVMPAVALIAVLVWAPYLRVQSRVHFVDVKRILTANIRMPAEPNWGAERLMVRRVATDEPVDLVTMEYGYPPKPKGSLPQIFAYRLSATLISLFRTSRLGDEFDGPKNTMFSALLCSLVLLGGSLSFFVFRPSNENGSTKLILRSCRAAICGLTFILLALTFMRFTDWRIYWHEGEILYLLTLIFCLGFVNIGCRLMDTRRMSFFLKTCARSRDSRVITGLLGLSLLTGQLAWSVVAPTEARRFLWLWPVECLYVGFALVAYCKCVFSRWVRVLCVSSVIVGLALPLRHTFGDWYMNGWSGREDPVVRILDQLADHQKRKTEGQKTVGISSVGISYDIPADISPLVFSAVDQRYSIGMGYDLYLLYKHSLRQELKCADSYRRGTPYLIYEDRTKIGKEDRRLELHPPDKSAEGYELLGTEGSFSLFWHP